MGPGNTFKGNPGGKNPHLKHTNCNPQGPNNDWKNKSLFQGPKIPCLGPSCEKPRPCSGRARPKRTPREKRPRETGAFSPFGFPPGLKTLEENPFWPKYPVSRQNARPQVKYPQGNPGILVKNSGEKNK